MKKIYLSTFIAFLVLSTGCTKKSTEPQLPPITHEGKNILACKINGEIFIASGIPNAVNALGAYYGYYSDSTIYIGANQEKPTLHIAIEFKYYFKKSKYNLTDSLYPNRGYFEKAFSTSGNYMYRTDSLRSGDVNVLWYDGNVLAGTFAFDAINSNGEIIHVTEGRFDIAKQK